MCFFPSVYAIELSGINKSVLIGMSLTCVGCWASMIDLYTAALTLCGLGQPFIQNATTKISAAWFGPKGRTVATTMTLMIVYLSSILNEFIGEDFSNA